MAENNSVNDSYNPPPVATEFEEFLFEEIETGDLLWLENNSLDGMVNTAHKKIDDSSVMNVQTGERKTIPIRQKIYQKT